MYKYIISLILIGGTLLHFYFLQLNTLLKVPDSFAYLQMSHYLKNFSIEGFGSGWFGFLYSFPIALLDYFIKDDFLSAKIINIFLFFISGILLYKIGKRYLIKSYNIILLILFFISSSLIHYNINILSENLYLPVFLGFILFICKYIDQISLKNNLININGKNILMPNKGKTIYFSIISGIFLALLYYIRGEAFIYVASFFLLIFIWFIKKEIQFKKFIGVIILTSISFFIFIFPYIYHLHEITGERGLTNKGASNLRQANMRGTDKLDDIGFEKAVGELTEDKHHLIAGFAGGLKYDKPQIKGSLKNYFLENPKLVLDRFIINQKKLYTKTIPKLLIGDAIKAYQNPHFIFYNSKFYFFLLLIPLFFLLYGTYKLIIKKNKLIFIITPFFITASIFFTLFFVIDRYFLIFIPFFLLVMVYGGQEIFYKKDSTIGAREYLLFLIIQKNLYILLLFLLLFLYFIGLTEYFTYHKSDDQRYELKKEAGIWLKNNMCKKEVSCLYIKKSKCNKNCAFNIMERFPIVTYYSGSKKRWLTPYVDNLGDLVDYAHYNKIDYLVVDSMDFKKYRPELIFLINSEKKHRGLTLLKEFKEPGKVVFIYKFEK